MYTKYCFLSFFLLFNNVKSDSCSFPLVTEFSQKTCIDKGKNNSFTYYYFKGTTCIPTCKKYDPTSDNQVPDDGVCPLGYLNTRRCNGSKNVDKECTTDKDCGILSKCKQKCFPITESCMSYHAQTKDFNKTYYSAQKFKPTCLNDGTWAPKQCKGGETGRCFCFDANGKRLFGEALHKDSKDMTCACSKKREEILSSGKRSFLFLHCDSMGNFEPLQCDGAQCWCAEPKTGELTSAVVPIRAVMHLPCYDSRTFGDQYFRQCDSEKYAQEIQKREQMYHGVTSFNFRYLKCDGDGAFGPYNVSESRPFCTWRDGSKISPYMGQDMGDLVTLNCNCARDQKRYGTSLYCQQSGNYNNTQTSPSGDKYCVDADGFATSDLNPDKECDMFY